ncbi:MAG: tyrosine--tRNA ligase [Treponema sp.]|jgi:tyrosyl-tRNA synthetase|nr:tyrosine--tRNA ligase [Treponema sp.]
MNPTLEQLKLRGFFKQCSALENLSHLMDEGPITFYEGCDPTGASLHIGHMVPYFAFKHLCSTGHTGIVLVGGGTARIGDPSGKTESRKMLSYDQLDRNTAAITVQLTKFFGSDTNIIWANNKAWLSNLNYIDFLRDIGSHFSVNRMLSFETYKIRMETGLSFIEFNYQLLQSYDFLQLYKQYGCRLQIGGDDQWGNIVAGSDLIRRIEGTEVFGLTFPLITTAEGKKMGKTEKGAIFLDPTLTTPYDFFQYWRNIADQDIQRFLLMFTFLPVEECYAISALDPNEAKERLAWELTALIHSKDDADKALDGARAAFGKGGTIESIPQVLVPLTAFEQGYNAVDLFFHAGLVATKSEGRRLIEQGGACIAKTSGAFIPITDPKTVIGTAYLADDATLLLRAGKKQYRRICTR